MNGLQIFKALQPWYTFFQPRDDSAHALILLRAIFVAFELINLKLVPS